LCLRDKETPDMTSRSPQDIQQRAFDFGVRIIKLVDRLPNTLAAREMGKQVLRSGTSVGANVQEADGAETKRDFIHKMSVAYKEARERRYWLGLIKAAVLINDSEVSDLWKEADELIRILYAILRNARASANRAPHVRPQP
jgi:four helix bundle protein